MTALTLTERKPPWVVVTRADDPWLTAEVATLRTHGGTVVRLEGKELKEPTSLFAAFARELSFPNYFGRNWDALVDCLRDRHGHGADTRDLVVLIDRADELIAADFLGLFVSVLCQAAWHANLQLDADGCPHETWSPFALHFVFSLTEMAPIAFAEPTATGPDVSVSVSDGRLTATLTGPDRPQPDPITASHPRPLQP